jgi:hypothetical protein
VSICSPLVASHAGKHGEAEQIHRKAFEARQRVLGGEHLDTLMSMNNLASTLCAQGKHCSGSHFQPV